MTNEKITEINVNLLLIGTKLNALKRVLNEKQLNEYNDYILDKVEELKPKLLAAFDNQHKVDEVLKAFLQ